MQIIWSSDTNKSRDYIFNKVYNFVFANRFNDALWLLNAYIEENKDYVNYIAVWQVMTKVSTTISGFIKKVLTS